jgi:hypothetical protein
MGCGGLGAVDPGQFEARYGYGEPDAATCLRIQCGGISQDEAGMKLIQDCANAGYAGARSCADPVCSPWCTSGPSLVLLRSDVVAPMPSITTTARSGCKSEVSDCPSALASFVESNPWLAIAAAVVVGAVIFGSGK